VKYELDSAGCLRAGKPALTGVSLQLKAGEFAAVCGLNGAGKSTLLETMAGLLEYSGACRFGGREIRLWQPRALARRVSFLPQSTTAGARFTAAEVVRMGRYPFEGAWRMDENADAACGRAMRLAGCEEFATRAIDQLSGGERQRVFFAAALAQEPEALLLDEPGTFVDLPHQIGMFQTLQSLCREGLLCIAATHDLNLAAAFCSRIVLLDRGELAADGPPAEVFEGGAFAKVFGGLVKVERTGDAVRVHYAV
jgi:iron complex transport system ATP-binding protein